MKFWSRIARSAVIALAASLVSYGVAGAADLDAPVVLVASPSLDGSPFEQAVVVAAPLPTGGHVGLIVNRPTEVKLETLLPDDTAARNVSEPVYVGGPALERGLFAVTRKAPEGADGVVPLVDGLVAVVDGATIDKLLQSTPNDARYFVGLMLWGPGELEAQVGAHAWDVRACDANTILRADSKGLWKSLHRTVSAALERSDRGRG
jgi:putative transcriptional regulator